MILKKTKALSALYEVLESEKKPLDVEHILEMLKKRNIEVDRTTVFRMVNKLVKAGILTRLEFNEGKARYELSSLPHHHHAVCTICGKTEDIEKCDIEEISKNVEKKMEFKTLTHRLELFGVCRECKLKS